MTRDVLTLTRILAVISIIALVLVLPACAEDIVVDDTIDMAIVEDVGGITDVEEVSEEEGDETSEVEFIDITADSGIVYEVLAATPLGRLAAAALEEDGFEYVVSDELFVFESNEILTLVSIGEYVSGEEGTWEVYENIDEVDTLIPNDELGTFVTVGDLIFVYVDENGEAITELSISVPAEEIIDEEVDETEESDADVELEDEADLELADE
jgi:hypothetical protein